MSVWYRGEAAGVTPSTPGGALHDFGDGVYFADSEDVAWQYAVTRAGVDKDHGVFQLTVEEGSLGKVLDLTSDSRWTKFMNEPMVPGNKNPQLNKSRLFYLRIKHELYGQLFDEFVTKNKLNVEPYDAIIGPEYVRGGKQLCVRYKNGMPTPLVERVRALLRPKGWIMRVAKATPNAPIAVEEPVPPRISFPRAIGGMIVSIGISLFLAWVSAKLMQRINEDIIRKAMRPIEDEIQKYVSARKRMILDGLASGGRAYVTASVQVEYLNVPNTQDTQSVYYFQSPPTSVALSSLYISDKDWSGTVQHTTDASFLGGGTWSDIYTFTFSTEAQAAKADVNTYKDAQLEREWFENAFKNPRLASSDKQRLRKEYDALFDWMNDAFGKFDDYVPNPGVWTNEGFANIRGQR